MEALSRMDPDALVVFPDTYERSEGWEDGCETAVRDVELVTVNDRGEVELEG
jgi:hypothetical protein